MACKCECDCLFLYSVLACDKLAVRPGCSPSLAERQHELIQIKNVNNLDSSNVNIKLARYFVSISPLAYVPAIHIMKRNCTMLKVNLKRQTADLIYLIEQTTSFHTYWQCIDGVSLFFRGTRTKGKPYSAFLMIYKQPCQLSDTIALNINVTVTNFVNPYSEIK